MKKYIIFLGTTATILLFSSCDMNKGENSTGVDKVATDSSMMTKTDATIIPADSTKMQSMSTEKPGMVKNGKKGKVSILMNESKSAGDMNMDKDGYYSTTEILPSFPGGEKALEKFFEKNIQYPEGAIESGAEGTVNIKFLVDEKGKVYSPKILSENIGYGIETEALRAFSKMPTWTPGKIKGKNVKTRFSLPIRFQLY